MGDAYKYEVYFECPLLDNEKKKKIETYFQVRRKSGGGECGPLEVFKENVYRIAFKNEEDQLGVLEKREHVLSGFPNIIVHGDPQSLRHKLSTITTAPPEADNPKVGLSSPPETEFPISASPSPPIGKEHEVHLDGYLLHHLKESSLARKQLEEELLSIGGLAQFQLDNGRVVVSGHSDRDGFKQWEDRVEQVFEKVKERCRPSQATDKVDIVGHVQGKPEETELPTAKLDESETGSLDKFKNRSMDISSRTVQSRDNMWPAAREVQGGMMSQRYILPLGVCVLVRRGDITKEHADALVNAANGHLSHGGGVAAALSQAGGYLVQQESTALVRRHGPFATGEAIMTTGGNLQCKKLIHIVGPEQGEANGREKPLLERSVLSALKLADDNQFRSIAMPCISSGIFQVPISVCAEAIVTAVGHFGRQSQYLKEITLIDTREEVVRALQVACNRILLSATAGLGAAGDQQFQESTGASAPGPCSNSGTNPVNAGDKVVARVSPMNDHGSWSTGSGHAIPSSTTQSHQPPPANYLQGSSPRNEETRNGALSDQPLTQHVDQRHFPTDDMRPAAREVQGGKMIQRYVLHGGVCVLVRHGDITKEHADVLVNAANGNLSHDGGVAAALSQAGGYVVQQESTALVRKHGPFATGEAVMTTGGNLQCKKLIHIIGPEKGEANGREKSLLKRSVWSALQLADNNHFQSIAMPCISSGIFQIPISVCAEAIVTAVEHFGRQCQHLNTITLIDTREEVVRALQAACDRIFSNSELGTARDQQFQESTGASAPGPWPNSGANPVNTGTDVSNIQWKYMEGLIETQEVDAIVSPMKDRDPRSTGLGKKLSKIIGQYILDIAFQKMENECVEVNVEGVTGLHCRKVFFVNLLPWDEQHSEAAIQTLKHGLHHVLSSCQSQGFGSVAFPMLGTGEVLRFPSYEVEMVLLQEIERHKQSRRLVVHIVAFPSDKQTNKALPSQQTTAPPRASFHGYVWSSSDEVMVGGVRIQLVRGNIVNEKTDVIVNTVNFSPTQSGVSKAILDAAGTNVEQELRRKQDKSGRDACLSTGPGELGCKEILHAEFYSVEKIREICGAILRTCDINGHRSVSFPALGTGAARLQPDRACNSMLDGFEAAVKRIAPTSLTLIRIVVMQSDVYKDFSAALKNRCGKTASQRDGPAKHKTKPKGKRGGGNHSDRRSNKK